MLDIESAQTAYTMLGSQNIWDTARRCHEVLDGAGVPHAIVGGVAVMLHGYRRNTVDVDVLIRSEDTAAVKQSLEHAVDVPVRLLTSGAPAGGAVSDVTFPDPSDSSSVTFIDGLPAVTLQRLIELKLACGLGNLRRTHRDFADVVELIIVHDLQGDFARFLHKSVRPAYRKLVRNAHGG